MKEFCMIQTVFCCQKRPKDKREYLFDNYRVLLIILVVIGHFIEPSVNNNPYLYELKWAIVAFHMPAFIFISGYFSKQIPSLFKMIKSLVIPYFAYEIIYYLLYVLVLDKSTGLYLARPKFTLWYLMALFAWRLLAPLVRRIPFHMPLAVLGGLLIGFTELGNFLSIPRIVYFFPFFLAGMEFDSSCLTKFRTRKGYAGALAVIGAFTIFLFTDKSHHSLSHKIFYGRYSYTDLELGAAEGVLIRLICYGISFLLVYMFMLVLPSEKKPYSYLGQRTMAIYIFHGIIYSCLKYRTTILASVQSNFEVLLLIAFCIGLVFVLASRPFVAITNKIANLI